MSDVERHLDSALVEFDNVRWDDVWAAMLANADDDDLMRMTRKYVDYIRADIVKARAALAQPKEDA